MRTIQKRKEPNSLIKYRKQTDATYEGYRDKQDVRDQLVREQGGLCCYCQSRIRPTEDGMKIEHWQSKSPQKYPGRQLDYTNMLGACYGGQKKNKKCPPETHHCDTLKDDSDLCFCLTDAAHPIEPRIKFLGDGRIQSNDSDIERDINVVLNLNLDNLKNNRKAVLTAFQQRLTAGAQLDVTKELPKWDGSKNEELPEYAQVVVYWLNKKQARATA